MRLAGDQRQEAGGRVMSWCLMTNRVHWVVVPEREDSLAVLFRRVHSRELTLLRYGEWNPVRAGLVETLEAWRRSSAKAHLGGAEAEEVALLDWRCWRELGVQRGGRKRCCSRGNGSRSGGQPTRGHRWAQRNS